MTDRADWRLDAGVLHVVLRRPPGNAIDADMATALTAALSHAPDARCVLLRAEGPNFGFGGDISVFHAPGGVEALATDVHDGLRLLVDAGVPVVTAVNGWAVGAGLSLVCLGDVVVASSDARFRLGYPGIGLTPDCGLTWTLPRRIGLAAARRWVLTDEVVDAPTALARGLVDEVVEPALLLQRATEVATRIAARPASADRSRELMLAGLGSTFDEALTVEQHEIGLAAESPDGQEGVAAFREKRSPSFPSAGS